MPDIGYVGQLFKTVQAPKLVEGEFEMRAAQAGDVSMREWGPFEHPTTVYALVNEEDHQLALSIIDRLVDDGVMTDDAHPQIELFELLFDAIYSYEEIYLPF